MTHVKVVTILGILVSPLSVAYVSSVESGQESAGEMHAHLSGVSCDDVLPSEKRPDFGCFNVATEKGLQFAAKSATGIVVEEDGRVWLSEFGSRDLIGKGGQAIATVGPLELPPAKSYTVVLSYAVMRPGDQSRVHTHPGPEGWYMIVGEQCLETPSGAHRATAGGTMTVPPNVPMQLNITGTEVRKSLVLVIHDSSQARGIVSQWIPPGACRQ
jgi:quercetin dioxygenase-like cupin family protein